MNKMTLRSKTTLTVGLIVTFGCLILTINSLIAAQSYYGWTNGLSDTLQKYNIDVTGLVIPDYVPATQFTKQNIFVMLVVILGSVGFTYWATGKLMRPLSQLADKIRRTDEQSLHEHVELPGADREVLQLVTSYNSMLTRLEESFAIQRNFAANAAHELKTPLTAINTALQVLDMDTHPTEEDYKTFVYRTRKSLDRLIPTMDGLVALTNEMVDESRVNVDLKELILQIVQELTPLAQKQQIEMTVSGENISFFSNQALLYRVFYNLVENAIKYNRIDGSVDIILSRQQDKMLVEILDTGIGMAPETLAHVFEPFYRADQSRSQTIPGSGLGLAIVKTILERYGGSISIQSEVGHGNKITVQFP